MGERYPPPYISRAPAYYDEYYQQFGLHSSFHRVSSFGKLRPESSPANCDRILKDNKIPLTEYVIGKRKVRAIRFLHYCQE